MKLQILYRGHLSDCDYSCYYCPFSKSVNSEKELEEDRRALAQFVDWVKVNSSEESPMEILFTPFGEALVRPWYRDVIIELSHLPHVTKVAIQTNLSSNLEWLLDCSDSVALWSTFHPDMVSLDVFLKQCEWLIKVDIRFSVGVVGLRAHFELFKTLREKLDDKIYLWVNAYKHEDNYYSPDNMRLLTDIDPYFQANLGSYNSRGKGCRTGESVVSIEGNGDLFRCNFIKEKRGNIFSDSLEDLLYKSPCSKDTCHCHIGYIHLESQMFDRLYGDGLLERIPANWSK